MNPLSKLAKETILYGLSSMLGRIFSYALVPFYTSLLLPAEYGVITELYAYAAFLNIIFSYGLETAYLRIASSQQYRNVEGEAMGLLLVSTFLFSGIFIAFAKPLGAWLGYANHFHYIYWLVAIVATDTLLVIPFAQLRLNHQALRFTLVKWIQILLQIGLNIWFLWIVPRIVDKGLPSHPSILANLLYRPTNPIVAILLANLIANVCIACWLGYTWTAFQLPVRWSTVRALLGYALPLLVMGLAGMVNEMLSRALLRHLLPPNFYPGFSNETIVGIFGACYKLSVFMSLAIQAFRYAADPFFFKHAPEASTTSLFGKVMQTYVVVGCFIWLAISINLELLSHLFLRQPIYRHGLSTVPYLTFGYFCLGVYYNLSIWFKLSHQTYYGALLTGLGALITILLNWLLVPYWGYWGAVWATLTSYLCMAISCYWQGQRHYPIDYPVKAGLGIVVLTFMLIVLLNQITYPSWRCSIVMNLVWTIVIGGSVVGLLYYDFKNKRNLIKS
jgi:O-antigen/teichoic acid export membrane protein